MSQPVIAKQDESRIWQLKDSLPHALLVEAETGLDGELTSDLLAHAEASDVFTLQPEKDKRHISVQQIRDLTMRLRTYGARRRVIICRPASAMTEEAQNALLKALEEPSDNVHFILEAENASQLLPTVISRCQALTLHRTSPLQDNALLKKTDLDQQTRQQVLFLASGRPALIRRLANTPKLLKEYQEIASDAKHIIAGPSYRALAAAQKYSTNREQAHRFVDVVTTMLRFHIRSRGVSQKSTQLLDKIHQTEEALRLNGNTKLAMLRLVVQ